MQSRCFSGVLLIGSLTIIYFIASKLGLMLASLHASASPVWPPAGIALAALLLLGYRAWPAIFVGAFLVNVKGSRGNCQSHQRPFPGYAFARTSYATDSGHFHIGIARNRASPNSGHQTRPGYDPSQYRIGNAAN
jgi:hypothetical protein